MTIGQILIWVNDDDYVSLKNQIQDEIDDRNKTMTVQQIDYFNMENNNISGCDAFILFKLIGE